MLRAKAFTNRDQIWLARGQRPTDLRLMAHEVTHVVQQGAARPLGTATTTNGAKAPAPAAATAAPAASRAAAPAPSRVQRRSLWDEVESVGSSAIFGRQVGGERG